MEKRGGKTEEEEKKKKRGLNTEGEAN